jgi:hypothetical protein
MPRTREKSEFPRRADGTATIQLPPLRVTAEESAWVRACAEEAGLRVTEWVRRRVLRGYGNGSATPATRRGKRGK